MHIARFAFALLLTPLCASCESPTARGQTPPPLASLTRPATTASTEEAWIQAEILASISALSGPNGGVVPDRVTVADHVWAPDTYVTFAMSLFPDASDPAVSAGDLEARTRLVHLSTNVLLDENERISNSLLASPRWAAAHESAALLLGAFALRDAAGWLVDVRPALNRMTAHLTIAHVLRGSADESRDGVIARAVLLTLIGRQADALTLVGRIGRTARTDAERAWVAALRLRNDGDWRTARAPDMETALEHFEHARALADRLDHDALLTYREMLPASRREAIDWSRLAMSGSFTVEAGNRFTPKNVALELEESRAIWHRYRPDDTSSSQLLAALNDAPRPGSLEAGAHVIDWGLWAGQQQRHLVHAAITAWHHAGNFDGRSDLARQLERDYSTLALFPIAERWLAESPDAYTRALVRARALVEHRPELVPQAAWTVLLETPPFVSRPAPFPVDTAWFTPPVPTGTAFDLAHRSLRPGCPRPPSPATAAQYAAQRPYDHWAVWANEWYAVPGTPTVAAVTSALKPLLEYDRHANLKMLQYMQLTDTEQIPYATRLCDLTPAECVRLGEQHLLMGRTRDAVAAFERWVASTRDRVTVSNNVLWLMRYYDGNGAQTRAEAIARMAAAVGSARGLDALGEWLDRRGREDEAEAIYRQLGARYAGADYLVGTFLWRKSVRSNDAAMRDQASALLRPVFPAGVETLQRHALDATPLDGVAFQSFGTRPAAIGLRESDIIVGVDGWRVRTARQFQVASRFTHEPTMTFTVWRDGGYDQVTARVPERLLGTRLADHRPGSAR